MKKTLIIAAELVIPVVVERLLGCLLTGVTLSVLLSLAVAAAPMLIKRLRTRGQTGVK